MAKGGIILAQILGFLLLGMIYAYFLLLYRGFAPYSDVFTGLALFLALFSALIFKSKTKLFKIANILFFVFTLYQLISYKISWDDLRRFDLETCLDENSILEDLKKEGIIGDLQYRYDDYEGKCILNGTKEEDGVTNG